MQVRCEQCGCKWTTKTLGSVWCADCGKKQSPRKRFEKTDLQPMTVKRSIQTHLKQLKSGVETLVSDGKIDVNSTIDDLLLILNEEIEVLGEQIKTEYSAAKLPTKNA